MKINYDLLMMKTIEELKGEKKKLLLHSCCGPCSTACIQRLKEYFDITVIYYNPNIEPLSEYELRKKNQLKVLEKENIKFLDSDYDNENFRKLTIKLKDVKEGKERCNVCFGLRLKYVARVAKENNFDYFTTTLTVSPHKNSDIINKIGHMIGVNTGIEFLYADFKKKEGYKRSIELSREYNLYRQNYCGCLYSRRDNYEE